MGFNFDNTCGDIDASITSFEEILEGYIADIVKELQPEMKI